MVTSAEKTPFLTPGRVISSLIPVAPTVLTCVEIDTYQDAYKPKINPHTRAYAQVESGRSAIGVIEFARALSTALSIWFVLRDGFQTSDLNLPGMFYLVSTGAILLTRYVVFQDLKEITSQLK